jgi:amino-acid N-acetyltransferase
MLPRSLNELYENIRDFLVYEEKGRVLGCCALHVAWDNLAEIKSLAVVKPKQRKGIGRLLVKSAIEDAKRLGAERVFALTYTPLFFKKLGFKSVEHSELPHKIWSECIRCIKFPDCDESALMIEI